MLSAKERVEIELKELKEKIVKLGNFLKSSETGKLNALSFDLLTAQFNIMHAYATILEMRLGAWND